MDQILSKLNVSAMINYRGHVIEIICQEYHRSQAFSIFQGTNPLDFSFTIILLNMSIVLTLSQIMRFLLKPLKQPKVICDIIAGIILGPSVLGRNENFAKNVITANSRFVITNIGMIGFMFFLFVMGVKTDLGVITKAGKRHWVMAVSSWAIPNIIIWIVVMCMWEHINPDLRKFENIGAVVSVAIITTFPVTYSVLTDMQLLSTKIGRAALTTVIVSDVVGIFEYVMFEAIKHRIENKTNMVYYFLTIIGLCGILFNGIPRIMQWINIQTPVGKSVEQKYVITTFLGVLLIGLFTDSIGVAIASGPLWLGLAIPGGPSIGATIVRKSEVLMNDILMPFSYATIGFITNVFAMKECWSCLAPIFVLATICYVAKLIAVTMAARLMDMSYRDSVAMSLMLSLRGQTEFLLYLHWLDLKIIKLPSFALMVILTITITSIAAPIINFLDDPTRSYTINKKRTIQHTAQESGLQILACLYDQESVASILSLLDFANPTPSNPFKVFTLYLVELVGRGAPMFIDHKKHPNEYWDNNNKVIHNSIKVYGEAHRECLTMNLFTCVTPQRTMYQDICEIALLNNVGFIILPFHKKCIEDGTDFSTAVIRPGVQSANANTFNHAPCSVGILACKKVDAWGTLPTCISHYIHRQFVMLFLGGPDAREALTLVGRMVEHPAVSLTVVRFLASEYKEDDELERKLDDGVINWFWMKNKRNDKVVYKEVVVSNGFETVSVVHSLNDSFPIDLWIVGRKIGINPTLMEVLSSVNLELGLIGGFLVSEDFKTLGSVLVVQQQVLRD